MDKKYTVREDKLQAVYKKVSKHGRNQIVDILCCLSWIGMLIWLTQQYSMKLILKHAVASFVFFVVGIVVFFTLFIWRTVQKTKYKKQLRNLNSSYLHIIGNVVEGNSFTSIDGDPVLFSVPIGRIKKATESCGDITLIIDTYDCGTLRCLGLGYTREAVNIINERCGR